MAVVCNGNVYLTVDNDEAEKYMSKGYSLVDERTGKIIKQSVPTEIGPLKKLYSEQLEINEKLTAEIARLQNKIKSLEAGVMSVSNGKSLGSGESDNSPKRRKTSKN